MNRLGEAECADLSLSGRREWLVTNGIGGYAMGTVAGILTRSYHGLLVAALRPPVQRTLLVAKLDETVTYRDQEISLSANRWSDGSVSPDGYRKLMSFRLDRSIPTWSYGLSGCTLHKQVWMEHGANTTYVRYEMVGGSTPVSLRLRALVNDRDHHHVSRPGSLRFRVRRVSRGVSLEAEKGGGTFYLLSRRGEVEPCFAWASDFQLSVEHYRGLPDIDAHFHAADLIITLNPGEECTIVASTEASANLDGAKALEARRSRECDLLKRAALALKTVGAPERPAVEQLVLAADQFVVHRDRPTGVPGHSVIAGYPWFTDWGRDTMISLSGLTLATGRHEIAKEILQTYSHHVDRGMLPNRFPDAGEEPEYNTVDATLWYFEAIRAYHAATGDLGLVRALFPTLEEIVAWHRQGTRFGIVVDPSDRLLRAGEEGVQLTWMDAKVDDWVVTPRIGKPIEVNALWLNALRVMARFSEALGKPSAPYDEDADTTRESFQRFWNAETGCCFDLLDGPEGNDASIRPNQLFAVSLPHSPLDLEKQKAVVDTCTRHLLTPHGLRSLSWTDPRFIGRYGGDRRTRDAAYHQGTVWSWLIGAYVSAHRRAYGEALPARRALSPLLAHLDTHGVGSISEVFDGEAPHDPRGCIAQAWGVAEILRVMAHNDERPEV